MPRIVHVAAARQRYATVPVLDGNGEPRRTPICHPGTFVQKVDKRGRPVFRAVTVADKSQPLPPAICDYSGCPVEDKIIAVGTAYKRMDIKTGPTTSRTLTRHETCPAWNTWDYSNSLAAQIDRVVHEAHEAAAAATEAGEVESALNCAADEIRELADNKREAAQNIEDGFGNPTTQSEALTEQVDGLDEWAEAIESTDVPEKETCRGCGGEGSTECRVCEGDCTEDCEDCEATGFIDGEECASCENGQTDCTECSGSGAEDCDSDCDDGYDAESWRDEVASVLAVLEERPV